MTDRIDPDRLGSVVTLYGASDDLIEVEGTAAGCDEYNDEDAHFVLTGKAGAVRIRVWYTKRGVWAIGVAPIQEGAPMLPVQITGSGYTAQAIVGGVALVVKEATND